MRSAHAFHTVVAVSAGLSIAVPAAAQWPSDPAVNLAVSTAPGAQSHPVLVPRPDGGSFVLWPSYPGLYGQRFDPAGFAQWQINGLALATPAGGAWELAAIPDDQGGVIAAWIDFTAPVTLRAQRFNADGAPQWAAGGVSVTSTGRDEGPILSMARDGAGGALVLWESNTSTAQRLCAQRLDASGSLMWNAPVFVTTDSTYASRPQMDSDGAGGLLVAWAASVTSIHAQHVDATGARLWGDVGVAVSPPASSAARTGLVSDGAGGAVIVWSDFSRLYAQRLDAAGIKLWAAAGVGLSLGGMDDTLCTDGAGGAYVAYFSGGNPSVPPPVDSLRVQHVTAAGGLPWGAAGVAVTTGSQSLAYPTSHPIAPAPDGGVIVCFQPFSTASPPFGYGFVAAQSVSAAGQRRWGSQGVMVSTAASTHLDPALAADPYGGATFAWTDMRNAPGNYGETDVYAQRVGAAGTLDVPKTPHTLLLTLAVTPCPAVAGDNVALRFSLPTDGPARLALYDVTGRLVRELLAGPVAAGARTADWNGRDQRGALVPPGVYLARLVTNDGATDARVIRLP